MGDLISFVILFLVEGSHCIILGIHTFKWAIGHQCSNQVKMHVSIKMYQLFSQKHHCEGMVEHFWP